MGQAQKFFNDNLVVHIITTVFLRVNNNSIFIIERFRKISRNKNASLYKTLQTRTMLEVECCAIIADI